jgi:hypothetical protein
MEPRQPGKKDMPDFNELNDRMIAQGTTGPTLVIKTSLDPKDATEDNPYYQNKDREAFKEFFEE